MSGELTITDFAVRMNYPIGFFGGQGRFNWLLVAFSLAHAVGDCTIAVGIVG